MFKINRKIEYALIIIKHFYSNNQKILTVKEIADQYKLSFDLSAKILSSMAKQGWFLVKKGVRGGYVISEDFKEISFLELIEVIFGSVASVNCLSSHLSCDLISQCNLISPMYNLNNKIRKFCRSFSVFELIYTPKNIEVENIIRRT